MTAMFGSFANYGFIKDTLPSQLFADLKSEIDSIDFENSEKFNQHLAGNIKFEFKLDKNKKSLEEYVVSLCKQYKEAWDLRHTRKDLGNENLELQSYWVNFQRKNEFNPMHTHDGLFSFAIWVKVPYRFQDELQESHVRNTNMPRAGMFSFIYTNIFGEVREAEFPVDSTFEGQIFLFPSCLPHTVYPFSTSDEYRISISGNIHAK